jgi:hypothetical protein
MVSRETLKAMLLEAPLGRRRSLRLSAIGIGLAVLLLGNAPAVAASCAFLSAEQGSITAVWANDRGDKVTQDEIRTGSSTNSGILFTR